MSWNILTRRQMRYMAAAAVFLIGVVTSVLMPLYASADDGLAGATIALSSAATSAKDVTYDVSFTPSADAGAFVIDFCSNSPVFGDTCTDPTTDGFSVTGAASATTNFTDVTGSGHQIVVAGSMTKSTAVDVVVTGITNPDTAGPLYARIATFDTKTNAQAYTSSDTVTSDTGYAGQTSVVLSIQNAVHVSGQVLETMTFCVAGDGTAGANPIGVSCAGTLPAPTVKLGEGTPAALSSTAISSGSIWTQISTNAVGGAVVSLKSSTAGCGGLVRAGAPGSCDIKPVTAPATVPLTAGSALFGVKTSTAVDTTVDSYTGSMGTFEPASGSVYGNTDYALGYDTSGNDTSGITSTYGDKFLDTAGTVVDNQNMRLTFGASVSNLTPAGRYSADISLIATGKF